MQQAKKSYPHRLPASQHLLIRCSCGHHRPSVSGSPSQKWDSSQLGTRPRHQGLKQWDFGGIQNTWPPTILPILAGQKTAVQEVSRPFTLPFFFDSVLKHRKDVYNLPQRRPWPSCGKCPSFTQRYGASLLLKLKEWKNTQEPWNEQASLCLP